MKAGHVPHSAGRLTPRNSTQQHKAAHSITQHAATLSSTPQARRHDSYSPCFGSDEMLLFSSFFLFIRE
jgi:hypothetical protein